MGPCRDCGSTDRPCRCVEEQREIVRLNPERLIGSMPFATPAPPAPMAGHREAAADIRRRLMTLGGHTRCVLFEPCALCVQHDDETAALLAARQAGAEAERAEIAEVVGDVAERAAGLIEESELPDTVDARVLVGIVVAECIKATRRALPAPAAPAPAGAAGPVWTPPLKGCVDLAPDDPDVVRARAALRGEAPTPPAESPHCGPAPAGAPAAGGGEGEEFLAAVEGLLDWMNANDLTADHKDQCPEDFHRLVSAMIAFRAALAAPAPACGRCGDARVIEEPSVPWLGSDAVETARYPCPDCAPTPPADRGGAGGPWALLAEARDAVWVQEHSPHYREAYPNADLTKRIDAALRAQREGAGGGA